MIPAAVDYVRPSSLEAALAALENPEAKLLSGGQSLLPVLKLRIARPAVLVDIGRLDLRGVSVDGSRVRIGSLTTWDDISRAPELERPALAGLAECARAIGDLQVRNRGTIGGSLAHADPSADAPATLLALDAELELCSASGSRTVPLPDFLRGPFTTALDASEIITEITLALPDRGAGSAYEKVEHPASGFALVGAAAVCRADGTSRIGLTGIAGTQTAVGGDDLATSLEEAEIYGDDLAPVEYRRHLASVVAQRALGRASKRAEEDSTWQA